MELYFIFPGNCTHLSVKGGMFRSHLDLSVLNTFLSSQGEAFQADRSGQDIQPPYTMGFYLLPRGGQARVVEHSIVPLISMNVTSLLCKSYAESILPFVSYSDFTSV